MTIKPTTNEQNNWNGKGGSDVILVPYNQANSLQKNEFNWLRKRGGKLKLVFTATSKVMIKPRIQSWSYQFDNRNAMSLVVNTLIVKEQEGGGKAVFELNRRERSSDLPNSVEFKQGTLLLSIDNDRAVIECNQDWGDYHFVVSANSQTVCFKNGNFNVEPEVRFYLVLNQNHLNA